MVYVVVKGKYKNLIRISQVVEEAANEANLDELAIYDVKLAVDEACSNIIEHAYDGEEGKGEIHCECDVMEDGLRVIIYDQGKSFNLDKIPIIDLDTPIEEVEAGGAGIYLMHKLMDRVEYDSGTEAGNKIILIKILYN